MQAVHVKKDVTGLGQRSAETRLRMIQAAIEVFGALGFEGASTRVLAERAEVNLAAIPYHFGGKRELYLAAAQAIADYARDIIDPVVVKLRDVGRTDGVRRIDEALGSFFRLLVGGVEPQAWVSFVVRCEHEADDAFRLIYEQAVGRFARALTDTVAEVVGCDRDDESLRVRVAIVLASIMNFRTLRNMTLSTLGWDHLDPERLERLERTIKRFALGELLSTAVGDDAIASRSTS